MNGAFSTTIPNLQIYFDSTSLSYLKRCSRLYQYSMCHQPGPSGWQARKENIHLIFGQIYHGALERYDHAKVSGASHDTASIAAVRYALESAFWDGRPWNSDDPNKNRLTLLRTIVWYLEQFRDDPIQTIVLDNGKPAVELSFRMETDYKSTAGEKFWLCGHMDRLGEFQGDHYVADRKTTKTTLSKYYFSNFNPHNQFSLYTFASKVVYKLPVKGLIVDAAQVAVNFSRFERGLVHRNSAALTEWYTDLGYWLGLAEKYARDNYWPMNDEACGLYGGCPFRSICSQGPQVRDQWLEASYSHRVWDPTIARGDV